MVQSVAQVVAELNGVSAAAQQLLPLRNDLPRIRLWERSQGQAGNDGVHFRCGWHEFRQVLRIAMQDVERGKTAAQVPNEVRGARVEMKLRKGG